MNRTTCRVCGHDFFDQALLQHANMPASAQALPDASTLAQDQSISLNVYQCSGCGLVQLDNAPVNYYKEVIRAVDISAEMKQFRLQQFNDFINKYTLKNKKIIEIGCGRGEFLSLMQQLNINTYGIEFSQSSVSYCQQLNLNVTKDFIDKENQLLKNAPFDAFFILSYLEHVPDINMLLRGVFHNLNENAVGLIEVPNFDMILNKNLFSEFISDHLVYFTQETLKSTLERNGFAVIECNVIWHEYIISAVVKKRKQININHFLHEQLKLRRCIDDFINQYENNEVAIWGAGHQALTLIALLELENSIKYVVDSAVFKQGKYTPATHLPIVSPDTLESDPVKAIIVIAGSFSEEVSNIIQQKYAQTIDIGIIREFGLEVFKH